MCCFRFPSEPPSASRIVKTLLAKGANVNLRDNDGWTALYMASYHGHEAVVETLLDRSAVTVKEAARGLPKKREIITVNACALGSGCMLEARAALDLLKAY